MKYIDDDRKNILIQGFSKLNYVINDSSESEIFMVKQNADDSTNLFWVTAKNVEYKCLKHSKYIDLEIPKKEMNILEKFFE